MFDERTSRYYAGIAFGDGDLLTIEPQQLAGTTITLDINYFLPSLHLRLPDSTRLLSQLTPLDKNLSRVVLELSKSTNAESSIVFDFDTYRRFPNTKDIYDIEAFLRVKEFFSPDKNRSFSGTVVETLETIAKELGATVTDISDTLNYKKTILQPSWTNTSLLRYIQSRVLGINDEGPYYNFMYSEGGGEVRSKFVFKSLKELLRGPIKKRFTNSTRAYEDPESGEIQYPILDYHGFDNYKLLGVKGSQRQSRSYFNYDTSEFVRDSLILDGNPNENDDFFSLTQFYSIDENDNIDETILNLDTGRSNSFTSDFKPQVKSNFHKKLMKLNQLSITTWGFEDIYPGDIVELKFINESNSERLADYVYNGYWMVERIVHKLGSQFISTMLLTRNGVDTEQSQTLVQPVNWRK